MTTACRRPISKSASMAGSRAVLGRLEDLPQHLDGALRVEADLADLGLTAERDDEQHLLVDLGDVQVERAALVEEQRELVLVEDPGELLRGREGTGGERGERQRLGVVVSEAVVMGWPEVLMSARKLEPETSLSFCRRSSQRSSCRSLITSPLRRATHIPPKRFVAREVYRPPSPTLYRRSRAQAEACVRNPTRSDPSPPCRRDLGRTPADCCEASPAWPRRPRADPGAQHDPQGRPQRAPARRPHRDGGARRQDRQASDQLSRRHVAGTLDFSDGRLVATACGELVAEKAFYALLAVEEGAFEFDGDAAIGGGEELPPGASDAHGGHAPPRHGGTSPAAPAGAGAGALSRRETRRTTPRRGCSPQLGPAIRRLGDIVAGILVAGDQDEYDDSRPCSASQAAAWYASKCR